MKTILLILLAGSSLIISGCGEKTTEKHASPAFMFWCYRDEVVSSDYHVPEMTDPTKAAYIQNRLKGVPGFVNSRCDLENRTLTISYQSSIIRKMNFEEAIALLGFAANGRPAWPEAAVPNGVR